MDRGARYLTIIVGTGSGALDNKNYRQGRAFDQFFQLPGVCLGVCRGGGGMLALGIDSHIIDHIKPMKTKPHQLCLCSDGYLIS